MKYMLLIQNYVIWHNLRLLVTEFKSCNQRRLGNSSLGEVRATETCISWDYTHVKASVVTPSVTQL